MQRERKKKRNSKNCFEKLMKTKVEIYFLSHNILTKKIIYLITSVILKKRKIKNIKQATSVLKKSVCYPTKIMTLTYILRCQKKKKLVKLKEDKKSTSKLKIFNQELMSM